ADLIDATGQPSFPTRRSSDLDIIGWNLSSLTITPTTDTNFTLSVTATSTDAGGQTNTASTTELVIIDPLAPTVTAVSVEGIEGRSIAHTFALSASSDIALPPL